MPCAQIPQSSTFKKINGKLNTYHNHSPWVDNISSNWQRHCNSPLSTTGGIGVGSRLDNLCSSQTGCWNGDHACNRDCNFKKIKHKRRKEKQKHAHRKKGTPLVPLLFFTHSPFCKMQKDLEMHCEFLTKFHHLVLMLGMFCICTVISASGLKCKSKLKCFYPNRPCRRKKQFLIFLGKTMPAKFLYKTNISSSVCYDNNSYQNNHSITNQHCNLLFSLTIITRQ